MGIDDDLGVTAEVVVSSGNIAESTDDESLDESTEYLSLAYRRVGGSFRIAVVKEKVREDGEVYGVVSTQLVSETPWLSAPRDVRLETFPKMPNLLQALAESAEKSEKRLAETNATVAELLKAFE